MTTLYDLTKEGMEIADMLGETLGELTPELEARLDALMKEGPERIEAAAKVVRMMEADAKACEDEADRLRERSRSFTAQADKLKQRMTFCLDAAFGGKVKTPLFTIWTQKSADRTVAELLPGVTPEMLQSERPDLVRVKVELDRQKCVELFKAHAELPEVLVFEEREGSRSVRIK
jgi:hypothetical protein